MQKPALFSRFHVYLVAIAICCLLETLCYTYLQLYPSTGILRALLFFVSGLGVCVLSMCVAAGRFDNKSSAPVNGQAWFAIAKTMIGIGFLVLIGTLLFQFGKDLTSQNPIDYRKADMLPLLQTACERWLHGELVYRPVESVWGGENIPYLPAMWMPFAPAILAHVDIRWMCILLTIGAIAPMVIIAWRIRYPTIAILFPALLLGTFMLVRFYSWENTFVFEMGEEAIPAFYYTFLFIALMYENDWCIGIGLALCTLSRFSLIPFIPFFFLWLIASGDTKRLIKIALIFGSLVTAFFIVPFFIEQPQFFLNIPGKYMQNVEKFWLVNDYDLQGSSNLGLAYVFGFKYHELMHTLNSVLLVAVPIGWLGGYIFLKKRIAIRKNIWAMAGLKLTLLVFYNFISLPFLYIFVVPTIISYPLLLAVAKAGELEKQ